MNSLSEQIGDARTLASVYIIKELHKLGIAKSIPDETIVEFLKIEFRNISKAFDDGRQWNNSWDAKNYFLEIYNHNFDSNEFKPVFEDK